MVELIAPDETSPARQGLSRVAGVVGQTIASEATKTSPIVVFGNGPQTRFYCLYGEDAIVGEGASENPLPFTAAAGDWHMSVPCLADDLEWVQHELKSRLLGLLHASLERTLVSWTGSQLKLRRSPWM